MNRARPLALVAFARVVAALVVAIATFGDAAAQQTPHPATPIGGPSSLPAGSARIRGIVVDASNPGATGDLTVALYALQPDGTPGTGSTKTAADGSFAFAGVSNDPAIVYLIGTRYELVPYGQRSAFAPGQQELDIALAVERPTSDASDLRVLETTLRIEALGTRLAVQETHEVENPGSAPIYVPAGQRAGRSAPFQASLPPGALDFQAGVFNANEGFEQRGDQLLYWGPVYAGQQRLRYAYQLPLEAGASLVALDTRFPLGTGRIRVLAPETGPRVESPDLRTVAPVEIEGRKLAVLEGGGRGPGEGVRLLVRVPETITDRSALSLNRTELSIELDDTVLEVTQTQTIEVAEGAHVAGAPGDPLLRFELPLLAEVVGLSREADRFGLRAVDQGIDLFGPLGPGTHEIAFRYRVPASDGGATLDLRFPLTVPTLLLRTADTGLLIESDRLHRLRPQVMGTRTWMLREAFHVEPDEIVSVHFEALDQSGPSRLASVAFVFAAAALVLLFVVNPLRASRAVRRFEEHDRRGLAYERDLVYATIRDLDHDFETGKVAQEDYRQTRQELRTRAIELMRQEASQPPAPVIAAVETPPETDSAATPTRRFCPACGDRIEPAWYFCSHCGGALHPVRPAGASGSEPAG